MNNLKLDPEVEWGNIEYKRYFKNINKKYLFFICTNELEIR